MGLRECGRGTSFDWQGVDGAVGSVKKKTGIHRDVMTAKEFITENPNNKKKQTLWASFTNCLITELLHTLKVLSFLRFKNTFMNLIKTWKGNSEEAQCVYSSYQRL